MIWLRTGTSCGGQVKAAMNLLGILEQLKNFSKRTIPRGVRKIAQ